MSFVIAVVCFFAGSTLIWVASHSITATSPWTLWQEIVAKFSGDTSAST